MKGRSQFSSAEADDIRRLLRAKIRADRGQQKRLRDQLRSMGFFISDFTSQKGFTAADFDALIARGVLTIAQHGKTSDESVSRSKLEVERENDPDAREARERRQRAAAKYKPEAIDILLVAEAPPKDLSRYFYFEDVREHDSLFRYVVRATLKKEPTRLDKPELLAELKEKGVFLIDLSLDPLDGIDLKAQVPSLVERAQSLAPRRILLIKATVYDAAFRALQVAKLPVVDERIPFPGSGRQREFLASIARALQANPAVEA